MVLSLGAGHKTSIPSLFIILGEGPVIRTHTLKTLLNPGAGHKTSRFLTLGEGPVIRTLILKPFLQVGAGHTLALLSLIIILGGGPVS